MDEEAPRSRGLAGLLLAICICQAAGVFGALFTVDAIPGWYAELAKPPFTPPSWVFAPVWIALYTAMGIAAYVVLGRGRESPGVRLALGLFVVQLVLNALWTPLFFGLHWLLVAFVEIVLLFLFVLATTIAFWRVSRPAALLLVPYLLWVGFAAALNLAFWLLNG